MKKLQKANLLREIIRVTVRKLGFLQKSEATCCGITIGQCQTLVEVGNSGEITINEIADLLNLDKSTVSRTVENLVNQELMTRKSDGEDRRYVKIMLTNKGNELFNSINQNMEKYFSGIIDAIPLDKQKVVSAALPCILEAFQKSEWHQESCGCFGTVKKERKYTK